LHRRRRPEDAAFLDEIQALQRENPNYTFIGTMAAMERSQRPWLGQTGHINQTMLARVLTGIARPIFYIAGPPPMVNGLRAMLKGAGVIDCDIRTESFTGY
jgi:ferredoxin-NADP reductase